MALILEDKWLWDVWSHSDRILEEDIKRLQKKEVSPAFGEDQDADWIHLACILGSWRKKVVVWEAVRRAPDCPTLHSSGLESALNLHKEVGEM